MFEAVCDVSHRRLALIIWIRKWTRFLHAPHIFHLFRAAALSYKPMIPHLTFTLAFSSNEAYNLARQKFVCCLVNQPFVLYAI